MQLNRNSPKLIITSSFHYAWILSTLEVVISAQRFSPTATNLLKVMAWQVCPIMACTSVYDHHIVGHTVSHPRIHPRCSTVEISNSVCTATWPLTFSSASTRLLLLPSTTSTDRSNWQCKSIPLEYRNINTPCAIETSLDTKPKLRPIEIG